jgi:hypothetical protein
MASDSNAPRSRRALLTAAAGAAAAVAATAAIPAGVAADDPNDVVKEIDNATTATTSITQSTTGHFSFKARTVNTDLAGLVGSTGDETNSAEDESAYTGVYGWSPTFADPSFFATGVWGDSDDVGTYGSGDAIGVMGDGTFGVVGCADLGGVGVRALNFNATGVALRVDGKVLFSRSGRGLITAGRSSLRVNLPGTTSSSRVFAMVHSNRSGRWVRAVVPATGYFTIYLNTTVTSSTYVAWFVIN